MKTKNIVLRALTMIFSALMIVPMVSSWTTAIVTAGNETSSSTGKISDFTKEFLDLTDTGEFMTIGISMFYIVFSLAMILIVLEVVRFFVKNNKLVDVFTKIVIIFILIMSFLTLLLSFMWCSANTKSTTIAGYKVGITYLPWFGGVGTLLFGILICIFGLIDLKKKSSKKKD